MPRDYDFQKELARFGPEGAGEILSPTQALDYCHRLTRLHYENFSVISWFLPRRLVKPFEAVYGFCRWSDDLGDETGNSQEALRLLAWWQGELEQSWNDPLDARHPVMIALAQVRRDHDLEIEPFKRLIQAFRWDQTKNRYNNRAELVNYCHSSADPVGEIVLSLFEKRNPQTVALSDSICTGLQLANFWQDVSRDLNIDRIYLPLEDMVRFGVDEKQIWQRKATLPIRDLIRHEVDWAEECLRKGEPLPGMVGGSLGAQIGLFINGGKAILSRIRGEGYRSIEVRPRLTKWDKGRLMLGGLGGLLMSPFRKAQLSEKSVAAP